MEKRNGRSRRGGPPQQRTSQGKQSHRPKIVAFDNYITTMKESEISYKELQLRLLLAIPELERLSALDNSYKPTRNYIIHAMEQDKSAKYYFLPRDHDDDKKHCLFVDDNFTQYAQKFLKVLKSVEIGPSVTKDIIPDFFGYLLVLVREEFWKAGKIDAPLERVQQICNEINNALETDLNELKKMNQLRNKWGKGLKKPDRLKDYINKNMKRWKNIDDCMNACFKEFNISEEEQNIVRDNQEICGFSGDFLGQMLHILNVVFLKIRDANINTKREYVERLLQCKDLLCLVIEILESDRIDVFNNPDLSLIYDDLKKELI
jgi:hypothetical protein